MPLELFSFVFQKSSNADSVSQGKLCMLPTSSSAARLSGLGDNQTITSAVRRRRTAIPERPNYSLNLWSIMKNCIGKDLSRIPMPVSLLLRARHCTCLG